MNRIRMSAGAAPSAETAIATTRDAWKTSPPSTAWEIGTATADGEAAEAGRAAAATVPVAADAVAVAAAGEAAAATVPVAADAVAVAAASTTGVHGHVPAVIGTRFPLSAAALRCCD